MRVIAMYKELIQTFGFTLLVSACSLDKVEPEFPDLVILPKNPEVAMRDYCKTSDGNLVVSVYNRGSTTAGTSTTSVDFYTTLSSGDLLLLETISKATPELNSEQSTSLQFKMPADCFDPDCEFSIKADALNNVSETDEDNNAAGGTCEK